MIKEDIQSKIDNLNLEFKILEYNGSKKYSRFKHSCGYEFDIRIDHLLNRKVCPKCNGRKYDIEDFQNKSNAVHNNEYYIIEFNGVNFKTKIKHLTCGNIIEPRGCNHLRGDGCSYCYGNKKYKKDDILKISKEKWGNEYTILSNNVDYNKKSLIRHNKCGNEYEQIIYHHLRKGGCKFCAGNSKHTIESVQINSNKIHNNEYKILSEPNGSFSKVKILHKSCGYEFYQVVGTHISGCGCPKCNIFSKGEILIENFLNSLDINFSKQQTFDDCRYINKLKFDFYLPNYNLCIEFDGEQHFRPIRYFGGKQAFELQKVKDNIKNKYCRLNNIHLIRFRYDEVKLIEDKLKNVYLYFNK